MLRSRGLVLDVLVDLPLSPSPGSVFGRRWSQVNPAALSRNVDFDTLPTGRVASEIDAGTRFSKVVFERKMLILLGFLKVDLHKVR